MRTRFLFSLGLCLAAGLAHAAPATTPRAVIADPAPDPAHPAANREVLVMSHGDGMNALFMLAAGAGPKPTMLLLHGLPGNEQNLDLAQAARRAGWNVLTLHYRGSWGSPGRFSLANAGQDVDAAMAYLGQPEVQRTYLIDPARIVIAGHSMGGFFAARYAARHDDVLGAILLDPWNVGASAKNLVAHPEQRQDAIAAMGEDFGNALAGTDAAALTGEAERHARDWDLVDDAPALAAKPLLLVGAERGNARQVAPLADAVRARGGKLLRAQTLASDHAFSDRRIALSSLVVGWLDGLRGRAAAAR
ncbi:S9 family peptidase [Massilia sp. 9096]|uniref:alpha/beta hydrolase family protein n=1 Tax=Massilia sp. 9096 TaxID=1500894 RepID=UPI00056AFB83|nr:alpha/beta fold hydrolase [Massilia sp. 9096]